MSNRRDVRWGMAHVADYRDLEVYREAFALQQNVFEISKRFPRDERYSLTDQVRRSSRSVGANLAETRHWLRTAVACGYLPEEEAAGLDRQSRSVGRMLGAMIRDADRWCSG